MASQDNTTSVSSLVTKPDKANPSNSVEDGNAPTKLKGLLLQVPLVEGMSSVSPRSRPRLSFDESSIANTKGESVPPPQSSPPQQHKHLNSIEIESTPGVTTISTGKLVPESILRRPSSPNNTTGRPSLYSNTSDDVCSEIARLDQECEDPEAIPRMRRVVKVFQVMLNFGKGVLVLFDSSFKVVILNNFLVFIVCKEFSPVGK